MRSTASGVLAAVLALCSDAPAAQGPAPPAARVELVVLDAPLAGFRYYDAAAVWSALRVGDRLELLREPDNAFDANAIRVEWRGHMLGYVPRRRNAALAWALDRGERLSARVRALREHPNPARRVELEVLVE